MQIDIKCDIRKRKYPDGLVPEYIAEGDILQLQNRYVGNWPYGVNIATAVLDLDENKVLVNIESRLHPKYWEVDEHLIFPTATRTGDLRISDKTIDIQQFDDIGRDFVTDPARTVGFLKLRPRQPLGEFIASSNSCIFTVDQNVLTGVFVDLNSTPVPRSSTISI